MLIFIHFVGHFDILFQNFKCAMPFDPAIMFSRIFPSDQLAQTLKNICRVYNIEKLKIPYMSNN